MSTLNPPSALLEWDGWFTVQTASPGCDCPLRCLHASRWGTAGKLSESKNPHRKFGGDKSMAFMQTMFKLYVKAKKADKSKQRKKCDYDSSNSSDSE
jgi:hypothetical protein